MLGLYRNYLFFLCVFEGQVGVDYVVRNFILWIDFGLIVGGLVNLMVVQLLFMLFLIDDVEKYMLLFEFEMLGCLDYWLLKVSIVE